MKKERRGAFGEASYREGALERLAEAWVLLRNEQFAGSIYMAGRGVEGMLRAVVWGAQPKTQTARKPLETGHDLRQLLTHVRNLGLLLDGDRDDQFQARVQQVARLWFNNMRFASSKYVEAHWRGINEVRRGRTLKKASGEFYDACSAIIKRCEALCRK